MRSAFARSDLFLKGLHVTSGSSCLRSSWHWCQPCVRFCFAVCCSFGHRTFAGRKTRGVVLFYCTQIPYGLKFCMLKECVAVCRGKRTRDSSSMGIFVQQLCCAGIARLSQALEDAQPSAVFRIRLNINTTALCYVDMLSVTVFSETGKVFR